MYNIATVVNNTVMCTYLKAAKRVDLTRSNHKKAMIVISGDGGV